jgi:hypothetical protein
MKLKKKIVREQETYLVVLPATLRSKTKSYSSGHLSFFPRKNRSLSMAFICFIMASWVHPAHSGIAPDSDDALGDGVVLHKFVTSLKG